METRLFPVAGMACPNCKKRLEEALLRLDGVGGAQASVELKQVEVTYDSSRVTPEQIQETAEDCGYDLSI